MSTYAVDGERSDFLSSQASRSGCVANLAQSDKKSRLTLRAQVPTLSQSTRMDFTWRRADKLFRT